MIFYLSNVAIAGNISQPSVRIRGGLHAVIHIFFLHGGSKSAKPQCDLKCTEWGLENLFFTPPPPEGVGCNHHGDLGHSPVFFITFSPHKFFLARIHRYPVRNYSALTRRA